MRINRYIARSGVTSRRKADELIKAGQVKVNGKVTEDLATEISQSDTVTVDGKNVTEKEKKYYLFNKPTGYTTTRSDPYARHTIFELLPEDSSLFSIGRLDRDTSGLILVTNDGDFAQNIIHPTKRIEKEYLIRTWLPVSGDQLELFKKGIELEDGMAQAKKIKKISDKEFVMIIEMGRKRVVRRMIQSLGNKVVGLKRTRIGSFELDVPIGKYRELTKNEVNQHV